LRLVPPPHPSRERLRASRHRVTLAGAPYRPGELPVALAVRLPAERAEWANESAARSRLPVELILRASIDGARARDFLTAVTAHSRTAIAELLDAAAARLMATITAEGKLSEYSRLLRRGEPASVTRINADGAAELLLPLELALAWRLDAANAGRPLEQWATGLLGCPPAEAIDWESAAASSGRSLGEWAYACALSSIAAVSASPHSRANPIGL